MTNEFEEFANEDELFAGIDSLIDMLKNVGSDAVSVRLANIPRLRLFMYVYRELKQIAKAQNLHIRYSMNKPFVDFGTITILAKDISFLNTKKCVELMKLTSDIDMFVRLDNFIQIDFDFYGLTINTNNNNKE